MRCIILIQISTYSEGSIEGVFQVGCDVINEWLSAGNHGHSGSQIAHHVVSGDAHVRLLRVESKVLPDYLLARGHGDLDGAVHHRVNELLHGTLDRLPDALLQLGMRLQQRDLLGTRKHSVVQIIGLLRSDDHNTDGPKQKHSDSSTILWH